MNTFMGFIGKLISGRGVWINQEGGINEPSVGYQNNHRDVISSDCNISNEQVLWDLKTSSYSDPHSSNSSEQVSPYAYAGSASSIQGSGNGRLFVQSNSPLTVVDREPNEVKSQVAKRESSCTDHLMFMQQSSNFVSSLETSCLVDGLHNSVRSDSCIYSHNDDSSKEKRSCPSNAIAEPVPPPVTSKKKASKQDCRAMKLSSLNNQKDQLTVDLSSASSQFNSLKSRAAVNYDDDSLKGELICLQDTSTDPDSRFAKSKKRASRQQCKEMKISSLNTQNEKPTGDPSTILHADFRSSNSVTPISSNGNGASDPGGQLLESSKNGSMLTETDFSPTLLGTQKTQLVAEMISYNDVEDSAKEKLKILQNKIAEVDPKQPRSTKRALRRHRRKAMKLGLLSILNEQLIGESPTSSHSDSLSSISVEQISSDANTVSVPSGHRIGKKRHFLVDLNSMPSVFDSKPKYVRPQMAKEESSCTEKSKKKTSKQQCKAMKISLLNNQNEQIIQESSTPLLSDPLRSKSVELLCDCGNDISVSNSHGSGKGGPILTETVSAPKLHDSQKPQPVTRKVTSPMEIKPKYAKRRVVKEKLSSIKNVQQSHNLLSDPKRPCLVNETPSAAVSGYLQSEKWEFICSQSSFEENIGSQDSENSLIYNNDNDSSKDKLSCSQNAINFHSSPQDTSTKKSSKRERKAMKLASLDNQNKQLTAGPSTGFNSQSSNSVKNHSFKVRATRFPFSQVPVSSKNEHTSADSDSLPNALGSQNIFSLVTQKVNLETDTKKKEALAKEKSDSSKACMVNESTNAALKKLTKSGSGNLLSEFSLTQYEAESGQVNLLLEGYSFELPKTRQISQKTMSVIDLNQNEVNMGAARKKSSWINNIFLNIFVAGSKTSCLINGSTYETTFSLPGISAALEQESRYVCNSVNINNGSHPHDKASTSPTSTAKIAKRKIQGYHSKHKILLVGEGNFSFSTCLARAFESAPNLVATSLNSEEYLECSYKDAMKNISELKMRGCKVLHGVDATTMANHCSLACVSYDRIIYNFPHCGDFSLTESGLRKNQRLVRLFLENSKKMINRWDGEIHIRHKLTAFFSQWNVKGLASEVGLVLIDEAPFKFRKFKGYNTKYGFSCGKKSSDDNFDCHPSCTYKFALPRHQSKLEHHN